MEIKEKIRKVYQKNNIIVNHETVEAIMQDKVRTEGLMRLYKKEEIESMNYIFGKDRENKQFTEFELELASKVNLFNRKVVEIYRELYKNRNNDEKSREILENIKMEVNV
ncbi:MAG: hypothetical protein HFJ35_02780 [Clostridia bacterium]|nr:hypothetical protein [Clostridia bacterium]